MHLQSNRSCLSGGGNIKIQNFHRFGAYRLGDCHTSLAGCGIDKYFNLEPLGRIKFGVGKCRKFAFTPVVVSLAIIPVAAGRNLKLNAAKGVQWFLTRCWARAENKKAFRMIVLSHRNVPRSENETIVAVVIVRINNPASEAKTGYGAVFNRPGILWYLGPAIESCTIE